MQTKEYKINHVFEIFYSIGISIPYVCLISMFFTVNIFEFIGIYLIIFCFNFSNEIEKEKLKIKNQESADEIKKEIEELKKLLKNK